MWLLPFLAWNIMDGLVILAYTFSYFVLKTDQLGGDEFADFHGYWQVSILFMLVFLIVAEVLVARYFRHLHFLPKPELSYYIESLQQRMRDEKEMRMKQCGQSLEDDTDLYF